MERYALPKVCLVPKGRWFWNWSLGRRGILGGIFVKIPPKTSKNVLLEMRALLVRRVRGVLGRLESFGGLFSLFLLLYARLEGKIIWGMRNAGWLVEESFSLQVRLVDSHPFDGFGY